MPTEDNMKSLLSTLLLLLAMTGLMTRAAAAADEGPAHKVVYQCNKGEVGDYKFLLFSVSQLKEKHGDNIDIVVSCFGPGIHLLGKKPQRMVHEEALDQMIYLDTFGVKFHACGNTMNSLGWTKEDLHDFVKVVPIGAEDLMLLQEQGYQYLAW
jgi:intracellular sulfur oxidation DsrE/DsrF family protein